MENKAFSLFPLRDSGAMIDLKWVRRARNEDGFEWSSAILCNDRGTAAMPGHV
jgi:hypothetical protein